MERAGPSLSLLARRSGTGRSLSQAARTRVFPKVWKTPTHNVTAGHTGDARQRAHAQAHEHDHTSQRHTQPSTHDRKTDTDPGTTQPSTTSTNRHASRPLSTDRSRAPISLTHKRPAPVLTIQHSHPACRALRSRRPPRRRRGAPRRRLPRRPHRAIRRATRRPAPRRTA